MKKTPNDRAALALHKKLRGKLSVEPKTPVRNKRDLSLVYTPGVAAVSAHLAQHPKDTARYTMRGNSVAIVSDGSAVLGLGNIGASAALPVMEGKALIFKEFAGIDAIPIVLSTQDTDEIIDTVLRIAPSFGGINLEDIAAPRCFEIEARLKEKLSIPVMHDDQHGTAIVVLAGLINACTVVKKSLKKSTIVITGAGAAGSAIAHLLKHYGVSDIRVLDRGGIIHTKREQLPPYKKELARITNPTGKSGGIREALDGADAVIGVSGPSVLTADDIASMNPDPIVFAMANPIPEIMPEEAKRGGARIIATGRSDFPNQINNSLVFPGIFRGALDNNVQTITDTMKIRAAVKLAGLIKRPTAGNIIPGMFNKRAVLAVASAIR